MPNPKNIFLAIVSAKIIHEKWQGSIHEAFKHLANSSKGDAGEEFIEKYATALGFTIESTKRLGDFDLLIEGKKFEIKTASEDIVGYFQFNHIRYDSKYHFLLCLGVSPNTLYFKIWSKADVTTGGAGNLATMGKNQNASFKLTKKPKDLFDIAVLKEKLDEILP